MQHINVLLPKGFKHPRQAAWFVGNAQRNNLFNPGRKLHLHDHAPGAFQIRDQHPERASLLVLGEHHHPNANASRCKCLGHATQPAGLILKLYTELSQTHPLPPQTWRCLARLPISFRLCIHSKGAGLQGRPLTQRQNCHLQTVQSERKCRVRSRSGCHGAAPSQVAEGRGLWGQQAGRCRQVVPAVAWAVPVHRR